MTNIVDLNKYKEFVDAVTSNESKSTVQMYNRMVDMDTGVNGAEVNSARLVTGAIGLASEAGEFAEIVKKMIFQGKPCDEETVFHMKRELGDIMWYWVTACAALGLDPFEVITENQKKLEARYGEQFEVQRSEVRKDGDL